MIFFQANFKENYPHSILILLLFKYPDMGKIGNTSIFSRYIRDTYFLNWYNLWGKQLIRTYRSRELMNKSKIIISCLYVIIIILTIAVLLLIILL